VEDLIELVAASFARHGIECPGADLRPATAFAAASSAESSVGQSAEPMTNAAVQAAEASFPVALPEHNFRKSLQGDPAP
jgi:hypothetical protein